VATGFPETPLPLTPICWGLLAPPSVNVRLALYSLMVVGEKVRLTWHCAPGFSDVGQALDAITKLLESGPITATELMFKTVLPTLISATDCGGLLVPTVWLAKDKLVGEKAICELAPLNANSHAANACGGPMPAPIVTIES